jgi:hypothetical protein
VEVLTLGNVAGWVERPTLFGDCGADFYHFALWLVTVVASALFIDFFSTSKSGFIACQLTHT